MPDFKTICHVWTGPGWSVVVNLLGRSLITLPDRGEAQTNVTKGLHEPEFDQVAEADLRLSLSLT